ncbi:MAG TPA: hypothetical protein VGR37_01015 [Longimicrobiaceae bacterium]|nr:hypothetical protein [Longimicrobiaceae bacterium]
MNATSSSQLAPGRFSPERIRRGISNRVTTYLGGVQAIVPRLIYGNAAGFRNNREPMRELRAFRAEFARHGNAVPGEPYASSARFLRESGYLLIERRYQGPHFDTMRARYAELMEDPERSASTSTGATRFILDPVAGIPELRHLLTEELEQTLLAYYGTYFRIEGVRAWRNHHVPNVSVTDDVFSNTFHCDAFPVTGLRLFVYFNDGVNRDTGAFRFHDKASTREIVRSPGYFRRNMLSRSIKERLLDPHRLRILEGDAGASMLCNVQECLHAAGVPRPGSHRDIVQLLIAPTNEPYAERGELFDRIPEDREILAMKGA